MHMRPRGWTILQGETTMKRNEHLFQFSGLAISRAIVETHWGKIWAESGPGKPNCFTVLLPLVKNSEKVPN